MVLEQDSKKARLPGIWGGGGIEKSTSQNKNTFFVRIILVLRYLKKGLAENFAPLIIENSPFALTCKILAHL